MAPINYSMLAAQIINILLIVAAIALAIWALVRLSKTDLSADAKTLWTVLIVLVPLLGPVAFFIVMGRGSSRVLS